MRSIIEIDRELCDGCRVCLHVCAEAALELDDDGKVRLVGEALCDGLGACVGRCPKGALRVVRRAADPFVDPHVPADAPAASSVAPSPLAARVSASAPLAARFSAGAPLAERPSASAPIVVSSPCPVCTTVSSGSAKSLARIDSSIRGRLLKERPVAPGPPLKSVSPVKTQPSVGE